MSDLGTAGALLVTAASMAPLWLQHASCVALLQHPPGPPPLPLPPRRWEAGQRLAKNLLLDLYKAAQNEANGADVAARCAAVGGVPAPLVGAYRSVLTANLDGAFTAMATGLPSPSELVADIPEADPMLLHEVRSYVSKVSSAGMGAGGTCEAGPPSVAQQLMPPPGHSLPCHLRVALAAMTLLACASASPTR